MKSYWRRCITFTIKKKDEASFILKQTNKQKTKKNFYHYPVVERQNFKNFLAKCLTYIMRELLKGIQKTSK